jgi:hypothetical protein
MDGQVVQVTEAECRARGGQGYSSRKEASKHCRGEGPTPTPRPRYTPPGKGNPRSDFPYGNGPRQGGTPPRTKGNANPTPTPPR